MVTGYDKTVIKHHLRYEIRLPGTIQYHSGYDIRLRYQVTEFETTAYKLRCMATGYDTNLVPRALFPGFGGGGRGWYDTSALGYDTILFWLRYKATEYDNTLFMSQFFTPRSRIRPKTDTPF